MKGIIEVAFPDHVRELPGVIDKRIVGRSGFFDRGLDVFDVVTSFLGAIGILNDGDRLMDVVVGFDHEHRQFFSQLRSLFIEEQIFLAKGLRSPFIFVHLHGTGITIQNVFGRDLFDVINPTIPRSDLFSGTFAELLRFVGGVDKAVRQLGSGEVFHHVYRISQPGSNPVNEGSQDQGREIGAPAFPIGIQFFLIKGVATVIGVGNQLVPIGSGLVIALEPLENFEGLVGRTNRLIGYLGASFFEFRRVKPA